MEDCIKKHDSYDNPIKAKEELLFHVGFRQFIARQGEVPSIAAIGSLRKADPDRIILKRIIFTGYPQRVSKLKAAVRFMFHNPEDVRWFKPVDVWTKCGRRRGRVKEPVGTHASLFHHVYPSLTEYACPAFPAHDSSSSDSPGACGCNNPRSSVNCRISSPRRPRRMRVSHPPRVPSVIQ
ncbi:hypothetical protein QJS10_CPA01g00504 [Acorus calamus]|uniref:Ribosome biogenesis protein BMS1/TSR1 C-terminal domain-containing protein n=1 Tax=Acorus calamus TaxID=4465 RepID=A0AAV9FK80_ACOCL|nr:hypothetical protein QJS10_CPA01g00504 [Acorus calamus]